MLPRIEQFWSNHHTKYIEPFAGSAALFFRLQPARAVLGDLNGDLINALRCVRRDPAAVSRAMAGWRRSKRLYYRLRRCDCRTLRNIDRAARFIYLNRFCFNGIYRTNKDGKFNVPYAPSKTGQLPSVSSLRDCSRTLRSAAIKRLDFDALVRAEVEERAFVYLDPPYATASRRIFRQYTASGFSIVDIPRLQRLLDYIDECGADFVLSYAFCPEALQAFADWNLAFHYVHRNVAGFRHSRRRAKEILVTNIR